SVTAYNHYGAGSACGLCEVTPNGRYALSSTLEGTVRLWDYMCDICLRTYSSHANRKFSMQCAFLEKQWNKQSIVACGSEDNRILMWNVGSQDVTSVLTGHDHPVLAPAAHPTHALMVSGSNRDIKMWTPSVEADGDSNMESNGTKDLSKFKFIEKPAGFSRSVISVYKEKRALAGLEEVRNLVGLSQLKAELHEQ
ncbi:hypothetical protein L915_07273, partial [Phytophthora nicotianae]